MARKLTDRQRIRARSNLARPCVVADCPKPARDGEVTCKQHANYLDGAR